MQLTNLAFFGAIIIALSPVLGQPTSSAAIQDRATKLDLGDGLYSLSTAEDGSSILTFTPRSLIKKCATDLGLTTRDALQKRAGVTCQGGSLDLEDVLEAWSVLIDAPGDGTTWGKTTKYWYTYLTVTAYACNYQANFVTTPILNAMANEEEDVCGSSQKGFYRCTNGCQINDLAIGITANGNSFCGF